MSIKVDKARLAESKELKVRVPAPHYLRLHMEKIMSGTAISEIVERALARYFKETENKNR